MKPKFFKTQADFRRWFEKHHQSSKELLVGFYKKSSGKPSLTWPESVDEALCYGWIDGVRGVPSEPFGPLFLRAAAAGADRTVCRHAGAQCRGTEVLPRPDTLVPPGGDLVGAQRPPGGDAPQACANAGTAVGQGTADSRFHPPASLAERSCKPPAGRYYRKHSDGVRQSIDGRAWVSPPSGLD